VVAPSSPADPDRLWEGVRTLEGWGLDVHLFPSVHGSGEYLAAPDSQRLSDLNAALADPAFDAVIAGRGGYGFGRIATRVRFPAGPRLPLLMGFSDVSLFLATAFKRAGWASLHGPNVTTLAALTPLALESTRRWLFGRETRRWAGLERIVSGEASGPLLPMNLSVLVSVLATRSAVPLENAILVLEDVGERPYRVDRMLTQLSQCRSFRQLAGLVLGDFDHALESRELTRRVEDVASGLGIPTVSGFPVGHGPEARPVPVGVRARLDASRGVLTLGERLFASSKNP
jgi:muramoyltetrapeptide carboxypeptidase